MTQPYGFINDRPQSTAQLKASLGLSKQAGIKFDALNTHIRNVMVLPGQLVIIGNDTSMACTLEEARLAQAAWNIRHSLMTEGGDAFALHNYDLLQKLLGYASLGIGTTGDAWGRHLQGIGKTLEDIDALHKQSLRQGGGTVRDDFLARRQALFAKLESQMRGLARYGTGLRNEGSIKKMLGISTRSYLHTGEISRYAETVARISKTAKLLKNGTPLGIALSTTSTTLEIKEACSTGREERCRKSKYVEVSRLALGVTGGVLGGFAGTTLCFAILGPTTGPLSLSCLLVLGGAAGAAGGSAGGYFGEAAGEILYEY